MELELNEAGLSESFGFQTPPSLLSLVKFCLQQKECEPEQALGFLGLKLGGPLFPFLEGNPASLRQPQLPPEFFPFATYLPQPSSWVGFVVDDPGKTDGAEIPIAILSTENVELNGLIADSLGGFLRLLAKQTNNKLPRKLGLSSKAKPLEKVVAERRNQVSYWTADGLGVVVDPEPTPFVLSHEELRRHLIETRDRTKIREAGRAALAVEAPGAAVALAREINWWLGQRDHWYQLALEILEEAYTRLERPLLTRVVRREWARHHGGKTR